MSDNLGVDVFVSELETGSENSSGTYPFLPLRDEITDLGVDTGDQFISSYEIDEDDIRYIQYEPDSEDSESRYAVNIQSRSDRRFSYHLSVNAEYLSNPDSPFYEKEPGDRMVVELDHEEKELRTYDPDEHEEKGMGDGYRLRHSPSFAPFVLDGDEEGEQLFEINEDEIDVAAKTEYEGTRFLVGGFNREKYDRSSSGISRDLEMRSRVSVFWDPDPDELLDPEPMYEIEDLGSPVWKHSYILPKKGAYQIVSWSEKHNKKNAPDGLKEVRKFRGETWLAYDSSGSLQSSTNMFDTWHSPWARLSEEGDRDPTILVPLELVEKIEVANSN